MRPSLQSAAASTSAFHHPDQHTLAVDTRWFDQERYPA